ncbi:MAG: hypothetical protein H0U53_08240 [Actinobacteria bacterium]|nr:hypothetical protein [Actinomycetota bacterium]
MSSRTARACAWSLFGVVALGAVLTIVFSFFGAQLSSRSGLQDDQDVFLMVAFLSFPLVGAVIATRQPRNAIGWILLAIGFSWEWGIGLAGSFIDYSLRLHPGVLSRPSAIVVAAVSTAWVPAVGLMSTFLLLLFPDGHLASRGWRPLAWISGGTLAVLTVVSPLLPRSLPELAGEPSLPEIPNPLGISVLRPLIGPVNGLILVLLLCMVGSVWSAIKRFRRSRGQERLQMKWLTAGAGIAAALYLALMTSAGGEYAGWWKTSDWLDFLAGLTFYSFILIPLSVGIAILKYRLYDVDVIINRALVYGGLTLVLTMVYAGGVVGVGTAARTLTGSETNEVAVIGSTLAVAGLFKPLQQRIQGFIDRRFYRRKYDAQQTLAAFSLKLRDLVDLTALRRELLGVVDSTMEPGYASLWLKPPKGRDNVES